MRKGVGEINLSSKPSGNSFEPGEDWFYDD